MDGKNNQDNTSVKPHVEFKEPELIELEENTPAPVIKVATSNYLFVLIFLLVY